MTQTKLNLFSAIIPSRNFIIKIPISFYCFLIKLTKGKWIFHNMMWLRLRYLSRFIYKVIYICIWGTHTILYRIAHLMMIWNENAFIFNFKIILLYIHTQKQSPRISISLCKTVVGVAFTWALMKSDQKKKLSDGLIHEIIVKKIYIKDIAYIINTHTFTFIWLKNSFRKKKRIIFCANNSRHIWSFHNFIESIFLLVRVSRCRVTWIQNKKNT